MDNTAAVTSHYRRVTLSLAFLLVNPEGVMSLTLYHVTLFALQVTQN